MSICVEKHPALITPYYKQIIPLLQKRRSWGGCTEYRKAAPVRRDPKRYHGEVMSICFDFIADVETAPAIKAFSLSILENLSAIYPDIKPELKLIIEERWQYETPAFKVRGEGGY